MDVFEMSSRFEAGGAVTERSNEFREAMLMLQARPKVHHIQHHRYTAHKKARARAECFQLTMITETDCDNLRMATCVDENVRFCDKLCTFGFQQQGPV